MLKKLGKVKASQRFQQFKKVITWIQVKVYVWVRSLASQQQIRLCIFGFCRSIEMLSDVVEDTVLEHGGEFISALHSSESWFKIQVVAAEKATKGGLHETLTMTVAVPLLWGVPPASQSLHLAVQSGGGIVDKVY